MLIGAIAAKTDVSISDHVYHPIIPLKPSCDMNVTHFVDCLDLTIQSGYKVQFFGEVTCPG